jgi:hypothetical protein
MKDQMNFLKVLTSLIYRCLDTFGGNTLKDTHTYGAKSLICEDF